MKTLLKNHESNDQIFFTNGTGASLASGAIAQIGNIFGIVYETTANAATGVIIIEGEFLLAKATGVAYVQGQDVGADLTNQRVQADVTAGVLGVVAEAAASGDTTVKVKLRQTRRVFQQQRVLTAGEVSGASASVDTGFGANPAGASIFQVRSSAGVARVLGSITATAGVFTVPITGAATGDLIHSIVYRW